MKKLFVLRNTSCDQGIPTFVGMTPLKLERNEAPCALFRSINHNVIPAKAGIPISKL